MTKPFVGSGTARPFNTMSIISGQTRGNSRIKTHSRFRSPIFLRLALFLGSCTVLYAVLRNSELFALKSNHALPFLGRVLDKKVAPLRNYQPNLGLSNKGDSIYTGAYSYEQTGECIDQGYCVVHFPEEIVEGNPPNACTKDTCLLTLRGAKGNFMPNQDRCIVMLSRKGFLAGLFDGHGDQGHDVSEVAVHEVPRLIWQRIKMNVTTNTNKELFRAAFLEADASERISELQSGGTTAISVWQDESKVHIASAGDSTAILVQWHTTASGSRKLTKSRNVRRLLPLLPDGDGSPSSPQYKIVLESIKHKPGDPKEKARIQAHQGQVYIPANPAESSRVVYSHTMESGQVVQMALAMSRSLGDADGKRLQVVTAEPDVVSIDLRDLANDGTSSSPQYFVILASDGVMDMVSQDEVIQTIGNALYPPLLAPQEQGDDSLYKATRSIIDVARKQWAVSTGSRYRDDISLSVQRVHFQ